MKTHPAYLSDTDSLEELTPAQKAFRIAFSQAVGEDDAPLTDGCTGELTQEGLDNLTNIAEATAEPLFDRISALESENTTLKAAAQDICAEAERALGEPFASPTQAVYRLASVYAALKDIAEAYHLELADAALRTAEIEKLKARAEEAETERAKLKLAFMVETELRESANARAEAAVTALRQVEWAWVSFGSGSYYQVCAWCRGFKSEGGHKPDCTRQAALEGGSEGKNV